MLDFFRHKGLTSVIYGVMILAMVLVFLVGFGPTAGKKLGSVQTSCAARVKGTCIEPKAHKAAFRLIFSRGTGGMTHNDPINRPKEIFGGKTTLYAGGARESYLLLPIIPAR